MALRANVGGGQRDEFGLSFEDILAQDDKKGMYVNRRGDILIVFSNSPQLVNCGRQTRTGYTRTGMGLIPGEGRRGAGGLRVVVSTRDRDTERKWKKFDQQITLEGNPHLVGAPEPAAQGDGYDGDDEADCG